MPARHRQVEQGLEQPMDVGGGEQIAPAGYQSHAIARIVERCGKMVARRRFLTDQHDIAEQFGARDLAASQGIVPVQATGQRGRSCHVQPPRGPGGIHRAVATGTGIDRSVRPCRASRRCHFGARALAGIEQPQRLQPFGRRDVIGQPGRLEHRLAIPAQSQPDEVFPELGGKFRTAARAVDILDPQQEFSVCGARQVMGDDGRPGVAKVQGAVGAGGKAGADQHGRSCALLLRIGDARKS